MIWITITVDPSDKKVNGLVVSNKNRPWHSPRRLIWHSLKRSILVYIS